MRGFLLFSLIPVLFAAHIVVHNRTSGHPHSMVNNTNGSLQLYQNGQVHMTTSDGHIILSLDLTKEMTFLHDVSTALLPTYQSRIQNPALLSLMKKSVDDYLRQLTLYFDAIKHQSINKVSRRYIPLASLGIGIANSIHLFLLHGEVNAQGHQLAATVHRVDQVTEQVEENSNMITDIITEDIKMVHALEDVEQNLRSNRLTDSLLAATQQALDDAISLTIGFISLSKNQVPLNLFDLSLLSQSFDLFREKVNQRGFQPIIDSVSQLFVAETSFLVSSNWTLHLCIPIPLEPIHAVPFSVWFPEPSLIQMDNTVWEFSSDRILLEDQSGQQVDLPSSYLANCLKTRGPSGLICPHKSPSAEDTCLTGLRRKRPQPHCQSYLTLVTAEVRIFQRPSDNSFYSFYFTRNVS